jgi:phage terminase large subunit-like protein
MTVAEPLALGFFPDMLKFSKGRWYSQDFKLLPWQYRIVEDLFGTLLPDGRRQYRTAYISVPRKNGKTEWAAGGCSLLAIRGR